MLKMAFHLICRDDFHEYEIISGSRQPSSSCGELYKPHDDYDTFQFVSRLKLSPQAWLSLLMRLGCSVPNDISHPAQIYKLVVNLCRTRQLRFYKLPNIKQFFAIAAPNSEWGIALVRGPNPHCHTNLRPEIINTAADAEALLQSVEANEDKILISAHNNNLQDIFPHYDRQNMSRLVDYLANKKILAYKIPVRRNNNSAKPEEYLPAGGVGDRKVQPIMYKGVEQKPQILATNSPPQSLEDCEKLLADARQRLDKHGYTPKYTDAQQFEKVQSGSASKERFLVSFQPKNADPNAKLAYQRESGLAPMWATSFDQLEYADTDPELIAKVLGAHDNYYPDKEYVLHIVDRGEDLSGFGKNTISPTWENMQAACPAVMKDQDPNLVKQVMTPEYQEEYAAHIERYFDAGLDEFKKKDQKKFSGKLPVAQQEKFNTRHEIRKEVGANNDFTGNGLTKSSAGGSQYGVVESLTLEYNPPPISQMRNVKTISLTPRGKV